MFTQTPRDEYYWLITRYWLITLSSNSMSLWWQTTANFTKDAKMSAHNKHSWGDRTRWARGGGWEKKKARYHNPTEGIKVCKTVKHAFASLHDLSDSTVKAKCGQGRRRESQWLSPVSWLPLLPHKGQIQTYPIEEHMEETTHQGPAAGLITTDPKDKAHSPQMWPETAHPATCAQSWLNCSRSLVNFPSLNFFSSSLFSSQCTRNMMHETIILQNPGAGGKPQIQRKQNVSGAERDQDPWIFIFLPLLMETDLRRIIELHFLWIPQRNSRSASRLSAWTQNMRTGSRFQKLVVTQVCIYVTENSPASIFKICVCPVCI